MPDGTLTDGAGNYGNGANCEWIIAASEISIRFTFFELENMYDVVTITSCTSADCISGTQIAALSGSSVSLNTQYISNTGFMQVKFTADD